MKQKTLIFVFWFLSIMTVIPTSTFADPIGPTSTFADSLGEKKTELYNKYEEVDRKIQTQDTIINISNMFKKCFDSLWHFWFGD